MTSWGRTLKKLKRRGYIESKRVEQALREVDRRNFVPEKYRENAYEDRPLPIGHEQTISAPHMVAWMTEALDLKPDDRVLEIGTGSGYQAAVLSRLVSEVYTVERLEELAEQAKKSLHDFENVQVFHRDGFEGLEEEAPFDKIILTAAPPSIPEVLKQQLVEGGILVAPVGKGLSQILKICEKKEEEFVEVGSERGVRFVPMKEG